MTLNEFKSWAVGQISVAKYNDNNYLGQCVSLINQYCYRVLDIPAGAWGNAKDWPSNENVNKYFDKVASPQTGDIGVMGADYGGGLGHIFIYLSATQILEQNGRKPLQVSVGAPYPNPIAILRKKGTGMAGDNSNTTLQQLAEAERIAGERLVKINELTSTLAKSVATNTRYEEVMTDLRKQIADLQKASTKTPLQLAQELVTKLGG